MNIAVLVSEYPSIENELPNIFVHKIVRGLQNYGHNVYVLLMDFRSIRRKRKFGLSTYEYDGVKVYRYAFPCGPIPFVLQQEMRMNVCKLYRYAINVEATPDIIHAHFGTMGYLASILKRKYGIPYIVTEHSSSLMMDSLINRIINKFYYYGYKKADYIVAVSSSLRNAIHIKYTSVQIGVIPNMISSDFMLLNSQKESVFTIAAVGRLSYLKRFDLLISALSDIFHRGYYARLWIIGDGEERDNLARQVSALGIEDEVEFLGQKTPKELNELLNRAHIFVLPSEVETFGVVYIEANACGLPIIATDCGGPSDIVNEKNGVIIPKNDKERLVAEIIQMKKEYSKYNTQEIADDAHRIYGSDSVIGKYNCLYKEITDAKH